MTMESPGNSPTPPSSPHWEHFLHSADIGVRGIGPTLAAAFEQAALALIAAITDPAGVHPATAIEIELQAPDPDTLLVDWLNELVYEMATRRMLFGRFTVHIDGARLAATAWGEPIDVARHHPAAEVKGATYTELRVTERIPGEWVAQCVVDV
jgi:tRNA nucleotidyltransferase (CCA-adding enzyme)